MITVDFSETIAASDLKLVAADIYVSIEGQGHFLTLAQGHVHIKYKLDFLRNYWAILS